MDLGGKSLPSHSQSVNANSGLRPVTRRSIYFPGSATGEELVGDAPANTQRQAHGIRHVPDPQLGVRRKDVLLCI